MIFLRTFEMKGHTTKSFYYVNRVKHLEIMEQYSEADIAKIINNCEILILPENTELENVFSSEDQHEGENSRAKTTKHDNQSLTEETEEDFEQIYRKTKENKYNVNVNMSRMSLTL